jgi:hypothetical protein
MIARAAVRIATRLRRLPYRPGRPPHQSANIARA